ncbi:MAG TPA: TOBE domain-containing protein [Ramlibacter sp.]|jgi:molybdate transport system regulatory protein|uniref:TOBE-like domain-containing protein n=1 Tax=Ramlibacter sp. TaxID=1917967 RepID=UPI002D66D6C0|nr:TOBE domain-containing protein [Ramlibacter sp.]HZY20452.1 TOBE domain-containing protein [Ramlibacter sp.]
MAPRLQLAGALGHQPADKRLEILRRVGESGSISQAAREAGVSYKAAWQALDMLSNLAGVPLVERAVGGAGGGGARLTREGARLLVAAGEMERAREQVLARLASPRRPAGLDALGLRTSMRNQLPCTVAAVHLSGPLARVVLALDDDTSVAARITAESAELLGLQPGQAVIALCKATAVRVDRASNPAPSSGNRLPARATRVSRSDAGDEIAARLQGGQGLVGFAGARSGLRAGSRVLLHLDEAAVVIALAS